MESNPGKFRLGESELKERKDFVERTRKSVQVKLSFAACCYSPGVFYLLCMCQLIWKPFWAVVTCKHCLESCDLAAEVFQTKTLKLEVRQSS